jgi:ribosomal protein S27E
MFYSMKCPKCKQEMEQGFATLRTGSYWSKNKFKPLNVISNLKGRKTLGKVGSNNNFPAQKCEDCKQILIDLSK